MRRHKPPTLVSMWMLDVFCCALGCVTLLWLLNTRSAADEARRAESTVRELSSNKAALLAVQDELAATKRRLNADIDDLKAKLIASTTERDETAKQLAVARTDIDTLQSKLAKADAAADRLTDELAKRQAAADALTKKLTAAATAATDVAAVLRRKEEEAAALAARAKKAEDELIDLNARLQTAAKAAEAMKSTAADTAALKQQLGDANAQIVDLQGEKKKLADKLDRIKADADARFAGIATTGKRVCFVVDISGSMKLLDDKTPAPQKWPTVVETVGKVMRSIPDLERYQVIVFSRQARFLFGSAEWQAYQGEASVSRVKEALLAVEPVGDTNLYEAFDTAFRLKPLGLDTVYLFSDGLPTSGAGLTEQQEKTLGDPQRTEVLSRHVRTTLSGRWNPPGAGRVKIHAVGFFFESPEVGAFLWALARENDGSFVGMSRP